NVFTRSNRLMLQHRRRINNHSQVLSDEKLEDLCSSNSSSFKLMKIIRDGYESLLFEREHVIRETSALCEAIKELCDMKDKQYLEYKRQIMFYEGTLHARGMMGEFIGYLQGMIQSSNNHTRISRKKLFEKIMEIGLNSSKTNSVISHNLSDDEKKNKSNELINELEQAYLVLSESVHGTRKWKNNDELTICSNNLNDHQICLLKRIGIRFLVVDENKIKVEKY
ncbi:unnamed protein product, partial [Rotaria sp. Silwood1]